MVPLPQKIYRFKVHLLGLGVLYIKYICYMQIHLKEKAWNWHAHTITLLELWGSDLMFRLEIQIWCSDLSSDLGHFNPGLKFKDSPGLLLWNLQTRIEWRLKIEDSPGLFFSIQDWRLKILQDSSWGIFNPGLKIENWRFSRTVWRIFNPGLKIEDSPSSWGISRPRLRIQY